MKSTDNLSYRFPVSIKAVIVQNDSVVLLKNERDEFELPGGKLEVDEQPLITIVREVKEELAVDVRVVEILDSWLYHIDQDTHVVIITYFCEMINPDQEFQLSLEHKLLYLCPLNKVREVVMPQGYSESIDLALRKSRNAKNAIR